MRRGNAMTTRISLAGLVLSAAGFVAPATGADRARIFLNGAFDVGSVDYSQSRTFKEFAEDAKLDTQYSAGSGKGVELGFHYRIKGRIGAMASVSFMSRDASASVSASLPHPLYLNQPRQASTTKDGLSYGETTVHVDFVYAIPAGKSLEFFLFAGPSYASVKADVVTRLNYQQSYPFDTVTVAGVDQSEVSDSAFGFNVGGGADYRLGKRFALGAQARFTSASAKLAPAEGPTIDIDAGGFQVAVGVRVSF